MKLFSLLFILFAIIFSTVSGRFVAYHNGPINQGVVYRGPNGGGYAYSRPFSGGYGYRYRG
jgi:hypothetical protein